MNVEAVQRAPGATGVLRKLFTRDLVLIPVIVATRQPVVSHNGYLDNYMNSNGQSDTSITPSAKA